MEPGSAMPANSGDPALSDTIVISPTPKTIGKSGWQNTFTNMVVLKKAVMIKCQCNVCTSCFLWRRIALAKKKRRLLVFVRYFTYEAKVFDDVANVFDDFPRCWMRFNVCPLILGSVS